MAAKYIREGVGKIPKSTMNEKTLVETLVEDGLNDHRKLKQSLTFSDEGTTGEEFIAFVDELMALKSSVEPIVQSGGIYGVSKDMNELAAKLMMFQLEHGDIVNALGEADKARVLSMYERLFTDQQLRNRNSLHPSVVDSCLLSNLLNFVRRIFSFTYASYATNGNESLSLVLFSYRQRAVKSGKFGETVVYVGEKPSEVLEKLCERLLMTIQVVAADEFGKLSKESLSQAAVVITNLDEPSLEAIAKRCRKQKVDVHIHVSPGDFRRLLSTNEKIVHLDLPTGVTSLSLDAQPLLSSGYSVYRDYSVRDDHIDLPEDWEALYISIHEGGSTSTQPLYRDLVTFLLGWSALRTLAQKLPEETSTDHVIEFSKLEPGELRSEEAESFENSLSRAQDLFVNRSTLSRADLEKELVGFQTSLIGGKLAALDVTTTCGGTRSICLAFEAALKRHKEANGSVETFKIICGNPHLAVERTARRLGFEMVRVIENGVISLPELQKHIVDPSVFAVFAQSLSYTDGITDPVLEALAIVEAENEKRDVPVYFINDCCLALSVVIHNDGANNTQDLHILDIATDEMKTPRIVTNDPHKHFGTDKGISTVLATRGALDSIKGHVRAGEIPDKQKLITAIACTKMIGAEKYRELYRELYTAVDEAVKRVEEIGLNILHKENRILGSTVFSVEDPSGFMLRHLKKRGHEVMQLVGIHPENEELCQTGWQLSMTRHQLRSIGGVRALDQFLDDVEAAFQASKERVFGNGYIKENNLLAFLASGNITAYANTNLIGGGRLGAAAIKRYITGTLDKGVAV